ncbi:metallophosphoesterase family protein [Niallia alba]|uniref:metallophosphoesterase family protein n=1 Tax=Niallia alba TaxID=2729105 RepID=UPI002E227A17|nr:metallophosphoesterase family protein [Niallia alba]
MKLTKAFVVSDIHGQYDHFVELIQHWDRETQKLLILGDMIDRGKNSLKVVQEAMKLKQLYGNQVIVLKGNHEDMLLNFLDEPGCDYGELFFRNGGNTTAWEFADDEHLMFKSYAERAELIKQRKDEINFIRNTRDYYEFGDVLFVHAGIDTFISDWRKTETHKFYWNRGWWNHRNETGKTIVYGHTPTQLLHKDKSNDIWINEANKYINIDGGAVFGGQLNGIVIDNEGNLLEKYHVV